MKVSHLDHLVLTVTDINASADFYHRVLGMNIVTFGGGRTALSFGHQNVGYQKINLHQKGAEFLPHARHVQSGSADLCFILSTPLSEAAQHLRREGVAIEEGPVLRTGAQGAIESLYFRDLDGNLIEISNYVHPV
ncbi:VOC family protein [Enterovibrio norvegicus]|uniref:VOC family protein n=1 Tax=Enterovibrio norvegicus TaxID=188144 RepID=UPI0013D26AF6|nr:VOC family protein [Enterovibrio norvegicus]